MDAENKKEKKNSFKADLKDILRLMATEIVQSI